MGKRVAPGVEKLDRNHYRVFWDEVSTGRRRSKQVRDCTLEQAKAFRREMIDSQSRGTYVGPHKMTLREYCDYWIERQETHLEVSLSTIERNRQLLNSVCNGFVGADGHPGHDGLGSRQLRDLTRVHIEGYYSTCLKHEVTRRHELINPDTIHKRHVALNRALEDAVDLDPPLISKNPAAKAVHPPAGRPKGQAWTLPEAQVVMAAMYGSRFMLPSLIALHTGLRIGEVLGLHWRDMHIGDVGGGRLEVVWVAKERKGFFGLDKYAKTLASRRSVSFGAELGDALRAERRRQAARKMTLGVGWEPSDLVVCGTRGQLLRPSKMSGYISDVIWMLEQHSVVATTGATFHSWRHTHATVLLRAGVPPHVVQRRLGHTRIQTTLDYYGHVIPSDDESAAAVLDTLVALPWAS